MAESSDKDLIRQLARALRDADAHIREQLQPEFENLAEGVPVSRPNGFTDEQALMRLATWWHGVDVPELLERAQAVISPPPSESDELMQSINQIVGSYFTPAGVRTWWDRPRHQLDGQTPRQMLADDPDRVRQLAEAGRSQG